MSIQIIGLKHNNNSGLHIPSLEEAGYEDANEKVKSRKMIMEVPEKTVVTPVHFPEHLMESNFIF